MDEELDLTPTLAEANPPQLGPVPRDENAIEKLARIDAARPGFPGEHWLVLALGIGVWHYTRRHPNAAVRMAGSVGASLLVARAASGRDGLARVLRYTPFGSRVQYSPRRRQAA